MAKQPSNLVANSLRGSALAAYDNVAAKRWANIDVRLLLVSNFATVSPKLLPIYAEFYNIASFVKGEAQTRAFLDRVIALYRKKGTPWAMEQALAALGYPDITIIEGGQSATIYYDATINYDGQYQYGGGNWATFRVIVHMHGAPVPDAEAKLAITNVITAFQPRRCRLISLTFD